MPRQENRKILAVMSDLFFTVKITDAARRAGMSVEFAKDEKDVMAKANTAPALIIFDLNFDQVEPLKLIAKLKNDAGLKQISTIGFLSHVQGELKQKAHETGCDMVLARSAFSQNLPQILKRYSGAL